MCATIISIKGLTHFVNGGDQNNDTIPERPVCESLFNVLVADCEGFLCEFVQENSSLFSNLELVIFEADYRDKCDYNVVRQQLKNEGFQQVLGGFQNVWSKR